MRVSGLTQARRLYRAGKYREVLRLLEPQIFRYRTDAVFYTLVGMSCLHTGEIGGASSYLGRAHQLDDENTQILLGLAVVHLKRQETDDAVACWLRVLDLEPRNRVARRGLELLRSTGGTLDARRIASLAPRPRRDLTRPLILVLGLAAALVGVSYAVVRIVELRRQGSARPGILAIELPTVRPDVVEPASGALVVFTERELVRVFTRAQRYLLDYRDNLAVYELNRILLSNATAQVKERALLLKGFAVAPDFRTFRDPFSYVTVLSEPELYVDCHVRWSGRAANTRLAPDRITFDLLVGYEEGRVLEGVVDVGLSFSALVEDGAAYEVLGRVLPSTTGRLSLEAVSIRPLPGSGS